MADTRPPANGGFDRAAVRAQPYRRRWLGYSLRGLFVLVLAAALPAWWLRVQLDRLAAEQKAIAALRTAGFTVVTRAAEPRWLWRHVPTSAVPRPERANSFSAWNRPPPITSAEMAFVAKLRGLKQLHIGDAPITDDDLAPCEGMAALEGLNLTNCRGVTDAGLHHFARATGIRYLELGLTPISDSGAETVTRFTHLKQLFLLYTHITDASMPQILRLDELKDLSLPRGVTSRGLRDIGALARLESLSVWLHPDDDVRALTPICRLPKLRSLTISGDALSDAGLQTLATATRLRRLLIHGGNFSGAALTALRELPQFGSLDLTVGLASMEQEERLYADGRPLWREPRPEYLIGEDNAESATLPRPPPAEQTQRVQDRRRE